MTDEQATALGKRLVACKHFRPMRGMLDMQGRTWDQSLLWRWANDVDVPDLRDPATLGCVLAMVRAAYGDDLVTMRPWNTDKDGDAVGYSLVSALEAAP